MAHRRISLPNPRGQYLGILVLILLSAAAMRLYALAADAPLYLSPSQGITMDGATTVSGGREQILFGDWAAYTPIRFYYKFPAMGWLSYLFFRMLGIGYWQANLISVVTGLLSIALIAAYAREHFGWRVAALSGLFMATNYSFLIYNRIPVVYTPLACCMALALYCWGRGWRRPVWYFASILVTVFTILFLKLAGIAFLPVVAVGVVILAYRSRSYVYLKSKKAATVLFFGSFAFAIAFIVLVPEPTILVGLFLQQIGRLTFKPSLGLVENVRFAVQSPLQFGIYAGFFARMIPLLVLAFGYTFVRTGQIVVKERPRLKMGEIAALLYLLGTVGMLLMTNHRPLRYMILLVPPMALVAAMAIDAWIRRDRLPLPTRFGRFFPVYVQVGLMYLIYLVMASAAKLVFAMRVGTGLADPRVVLDVRTLFGLLVAALILAGVGTLAFLWRTVHLRRHFVALPSAKVRLWFAALLVTILVAGDMYQYWKYMRAPEYTMVEASRQVGRDFDPATTVLGGNFAHVLSVENDIPAILFYSNYAGGDLLTLGFTHLALDDATGDVAMRAFFPDIMERAALVRTYRVRPYEVRVYEIGPVG